LSATPIPNARHVAHLAAALALMAMLIVACDGNDDATQPAPSTPEEPAARTVETPPSSQLDSSEPCQYLATSISDELSRWVGSDEILNAPIAETRLGAQPEGGIPGILADGCIWEVQGPDGGHVGVAVERFTNIDMTQLATLAAEASVIPSELAGGNNRWDIPASSDSPSGAVLVGGADELVVVRVESYSDNADRTFVATTLDGAGGFFAAVGDQVVASLLD
jgi:hypothetical protein